MPEQIVKQRSRGFICINAHPEGCAAMVERQIQAMSAGRPPGLSGAQNVLVVGASTGYGLATRIAAAWGFGAKTLGVFFERPPEGKKTATAGYYNSAAFHRRARRDGLYSASVNGDAFSDEVKRETAGLIRKDLGKLDLVVYSLAAPRRANPRDGRTYQSVLKPIGQSFTGKTVDLSTRIVADVTVEPASQQEIDDTVAVMGGEDWQWWIELLLDENLLAQGARTLAYTYIGPKVTWPVYRDGTIGLAKKHLAATARHLDGVLQSRLGGNAWVSVNKAVVTQASAAIPMIPLYVSLLFRVMKRKGLHEGCIEQMRRLVFEHLAAGKTPTTDEQGMIRLDDLELRDDVQTEVMDLWSQANTENLEEISDLAGFRLDFNNLFGFEVDGVDYGQPAETDLAI
jgi:enoyl-[acyl-carrier protein] reductase / trans-2-enoyl-CoA reductase (NAD+)